MINQISRFQLFVMIVLFEIGSTPLFALGSSAKQDAWLSMSAAAIAGFLLLLLFLSIQQKARDQDLIGLLKICFGRILGTSLGVWFACYFAYESMRNVRDFGEIANLTLLSTTPKYITMFIILLLAFYAIVMGVETLFRVTEALLPIVAFSYGFLIFLICIARLIHLDNLLPIMENGPTPVLKAAFPDIVSFPFGQTVIFFMVWHMLPRDQKIKRLSLAAYTSVSVFLIFMNILNIVVLGTTLASNSTLPLLEMVQLIEVGDIFERLDVLVTLLLFLGLFVKMTTFYWGSVYAMAHICPAISKRYWLLLIGSIIFITSFLEPNYTYHTWLGLIVSVKVYPLFQVIIPLMMYILLKIRKIPAPQSSPEA
ncbi:GerAB/ArcD/ProY family transporter [Paenibacillus roseipurpureus]|uniref:GerAB/ArcD/ProY family transporter n=1 Tax=Paenibacillus roseopurpureus TaxID=2918901 RepID=A0AA96RJX1_9BACL|nr:GerAB/ArcD/ProY family transporter [Paenibacillus sp. MBLB1832]WNR43714.1 GerAB/ArcD/ProY family transporter [Paenibacillus sp. MBLB1832]